jgi:hypothetical protein
MRVAVSSQATTGVWRCRADGIAAYHVNTILGVYTAISGPVFMIAQTIEYLNLKVFSTSCADFIGFILCVSG